MLSWLILFFRFLPLVPSSPFESLHPEEGDYGPAYPVVSVGLYLEEDAHVLPYLFGFLENLDYPKDRTVLDFHVSNRIDSTIEKVKWWLKEVNGLYHRTQLMLNSENWRESVLRSARIARSSYVLLFTADDFFMEPRLLQKLIARKELIISPFLYDFSVLDSRLNADNAVTPTATSVTRVTDMALLVDLLHSDVSYLTFSADNLFNYTKSSDVFDVFSESLSRVGAHVFVDHDDFYGYKLTCAKCSLDAKRKRMNVFVASIIGNYGITAIDVSTFVKPQYAKPSLFGMDQIYVINLERRVQRRKRIEKLLKLLGFKYLLWTATDGKNLYDEPLYKKVVLLDNYEDPYYKRPMKAGEIGCFLSHYRIWKDVVDKNYSQVIVLEDDLTFDINGTDRLVELKQDLDNGDLVWDLIYLGRKQLSSIGENWVKEIRHLSTVGYSYWTIGYMLSQAGAQKLLRAKPLEKLLPVDEYIPIMFDRHPNTTWKNAFPTRDLVAFTTYPSIVYPEKYTNDYGYVSDTEDSPIVVESKDLKLLDTVWKIEPSLVDGTLDSLSSESNLSSDRDEL